MGFWTVSGALASIAGLIIAFYLLKIAKKAKKAAEEAVNEAKKLIYGKSKFTELKEIEKNIDQIIIHIDKGEKNILRYWVTESLNRISYFSGKWENEIKGRGMISRIFEELEIMLKDIDKAKKTGLSEQAKSRYKVAISKVLRNLNKEIGYYDSKIS